MPPGYSTYKEGDEIDGSEDSRHFLDRLIIEIPNTPSTEREKENEELGFMVSTLPESDTTTNITYRPRVCRERENVDQL